MRCVWAILLLLTSTTVSGQEPIASTAAVTGVAPVATASTLSSLRAAKAFQSLAQNGNAEAMYLLGNLLLKYSPDPGSADTALLRSWHEVGDASTGAKWISKSANRGFAPAREMLCRAASDPAAPAQRRARATKWCAPRENPWKAER